MIAFAPHIYCLPLPQARSVYGLLCYDCGSRCDWEEHEGLTHFLEHALFKGVRHLSGRSLFDRIERYGGELNAFTTKDKMGIEVWVPPQALPVALNVLRLLAEEATLAGSAVEKERQVILEELSMYEDIPEEALLDRYEEVIFVRGGLRHPIIGYREALLNTDAEVLRRYYREVWQKSPWVLLIGGAVSGREVEQVLRRSGWLMRERLTKPLWHSNEHWERPEGPLMFYRPIQQTHIVVGGIGPSPYERASMALQLILQALGGPYLSSLLNLLLRERYGWGYSVYSFFHAYPEKSVWGIYAGVMAQAEKRVLEVIQKQLHRWQAGLLSEKRLQALKRQFLGRQAILWEKLSYRLQVQARWLLDRGVLLNEAEWQTTFQSISVQEVQEAATRFLKQPWIAVLRPTRQ